MNIKYQRLTLTRGTDGRLMSAAIQEYNGRFTVLPDGGVAWPCWETIRELPIEGEKIILSKTDESVDQSMMNSVATTQELIQAERDARDDAYHERNMVIALLARMAKSIGWPVGLAQHKPAQEGEAWDDTWATVVLIDLPTGQVSWHLHVGELPLFAALGEYPGEWDGHTTEEKYERVKRFIAQIAINQEGERPTRVSWRRSGGEKLTVTSSDENEIEERLHGLFVCHLNGKISNLLIEH